MSSSFALKQQQHQQQHHHHLLHHNHHHQQQQQQQQQSSSSFSVHDILCSSLYDYYNAATATSTSLPAASRTGRTVVKDPGLDRTSVSSVTEEAQATDNGEDRLGADCDRDQYSGQIAAAAAFYAGSNAALYGSMSSGGGSAGGGACSPHHHTLHHHNHHHPHHPSAAAAAAAFASQYAGAPADLGHYPGSAGTAGFSADSMPVRGCVGGPWYAPSPAPDPRLTSKLNHLEIN